jgi:hypothetical protein
VIWILELDDDPLHLDDWAKVYIHMYVLECTTWYIPVHARVISLAIITGKPGPLAGWELESLIIMMSASGTLPIFYIEYKHPGPI